MQKANHDRRPGLHELTTGQRVMTRNYCSGATWIPGEVAGKLGPLTYQVKLQSGSLCKKHIDQLQELRDTAMTGASNAADVEAYFPSISEDSQDNAEMPANASGRLQQHEEINLDPISECRYPLRECHPPDRYSS